MKKIITLITLILLLSLSCSSYAIEPDKKKHILASSVISTVIYLKTKSKKKAFYGCMAVGIAKELTDKHVSGKDIVADAVGCFIMPYGIHLIKDGFGIKKTWRF